jgi:iron complex outermembrane receptor protein
LVAGSSAVAMLGALPAGAQQANRSRVDAGALEEIVVTAQRRETRVQETPESIQVLSGELLNEQSLRVWQDYVAKVPSIQGAGQDRVPVFGKQSFFMRGLSSTGDIANSGTAAVYLDELPLALESPPRILDVNRIEVLKGPQGTLYGEAAMGGAVRIISNQPQFDRVSGATHVDLSDMRGGGQSYGVDATINVPLIDDRLAFRASVYYDKQGGFVDSWPFSYKSRPTVRPPSYLINKDANTSTAYGAKAALRWKISDAFTATLTGWADVVRQTGDNGVLTQFFATKEYVQYRRFEHDLPQRVYAGSLVLEYEFPFANLMSATSYYTKTFNPVYDGTSFSTALGFTGPTRPGDAGPLVYDIPRHRFSQEVRIVSKPNGPLNYVAGVYYLDTGYRFNISARALGASQITPAIPGLLLPEECYLCVNFDYPTTQKAVFGELSYEFLPGLKATVGARYNDLKQSSSRTDLGFTPLTQPPSNTSSSATKTVYKAELSYQPMKDLLVYANLRQGFRQGFGAVLPPPFCQPQLNAIGIPNPKNQVDPDSVDTYEIGAKSTLPVLGGALRANAAGYRTKWKDVQSSIGLTCGFSFTTNFGSATIQGAELELEYGIERWNVGVNGSFTQSSYDTTGPGRVAGQQLSLVPRWQATTYTRYSFPLRGAWSGYVGGDFQYMTRRPFALPGLIDRQLPIYRNLNARVGVNNDTWEVQLYVKNATNEYLPIGQPTNIPGENNRALLAAPLAVGISLGYQF